MLSVFPRVWRRAAARLGSVENHSSGAFSGLRTRGLGWAGLLLVLCAGLLACAPSPSTAGAKETQVVVFAAASLREVFSSLGKDFEKAHPGVEVSFHFAGTQELRTQLEQGAAVDVFASADMRHMNELQGAGLVAAPVVFARNEPVIVVSKESAGLVASVADLPKVSRLVVGAPEVPIGKYTQQILEKASGSLGSDFAARVEANIVSREMNVRQVLSKVSLGEAQAGLVYRTDALSAKEAVGVVTIPGEMNVLAEYPIAITQAPPHPELARAWVELVRSEAGQKALSAAGFLAPLP